MSDIKEAIRLLEELAGERFFGALELKFEAGHIVVMRKTETLKPNYRDNRGIHEHDQQSS